MRVVIAGCGYVGSELARRLVRRGDDVVGLRRTVAALPDGVRGVSVDLVDPSTFAEVPREADALVYCAAPGPGGSYRGAYVDGLRAISAHVRAPRGVFVSSTSVYGDAGGAWVDEDTAAAPESDNARTLLEAESLATQSGLTVLRLAGIYGPGRDRLIRQARSGEAQCADGVEYGNRIHLFDCAGAIRHLLDLAAPAELYVGVDDAPVDLCEVRAWIADTLGVPPPARGGPGSTRGGGKRLRNTRLVQSGYVFEVPSYREGYGAMMRG